jgi:phosphoserine phosphatase RsbU/P
VSTPLPAAAPAPPRRRSCTLWLPGQASSVKAVREAARAFISAGGCCDEEDGVALVVSELGTNAVLALRAVLAAHQGPGPLPAEKTQIRLALAWVGPCRVRAALWDPVATTPTARTADHASEDGRGLFIVEFYATTWGVTARTHGKEVWAHIDVQPR